MSGAVDDACPLSGNGAISMAPNPFDQFNPQASGVETSSPNPFDQFDATKNSLAGRSSAAAGAPRYLSDDEFLTPGTPVVGPPSSAPNNSAPLPQTGATISGDGLTLGHLASPAPTATPTQGSSSFLTDDEVRAIDNAAPPAPKYLTDAEFLTPSTAQNPNGPLANSDSDNWLTSAAKSFGTAAIKGLSNSFGTVGNLSNFADYLVARGESAVTGKPVADVYADIQAQRAQEEAQSPILSHLPDPRQVMPSGEQIAAPILKKTGEYVPTSGAGQAVQTGLETAFGMVGPGGGAKALEASLVQAALKAPLAAAPANIAAGAAGQVATDVTGDPLAGMAVGNTAAGLGHVGANMVGAYTRPFAEDLPGIGRGFAGTRDAMVGEQLRARATDPSAVDRALNPGPLQPGQEPNYSLVPGSQPTLGQLTNDMGILQAERQAQTADNSEFNLRQGEQNTAQLAALRGARPANASAMSAPEAFQAHLDNINAAEDAAVGLMTNRAQDAASGLSPTMTPEDRGAAIRNGVEAVKQEAKAARETVRRAVDPDGTLNVVAAPVSQTSSGILSRIGQYTKPPEGEEANLLNIGKNLPDVMPFGDLMEYDNRVTQAMKAERGTNGESPSWARLARLKGATMGAMNNAVAHQAAWEAEQSAASGNVPDTIQQRLSDNIDAMAQRQAAVWGINGRGNLGHSANAFSATREDASPVGGNVYGEASGVSTPSASGVLRASGPGRGGFSDATGTPGISPSSLRPNIDAEAAARIAASKASDRAYAQTYKQRGPVSDVLKGPFKGVYNVPNSAVAGRAVVPGDRGYQTLKSFFAAAKNDPQVIHAAQDHLVSQLASKAQNVDGTISPTEFAKWQKSYGPAIRAMDEAGPGFSNRYKTAARATEDMLAAGVAKKNAVDAFNKSQAAKFIGKTNPVEVENQIGSMLNAKQNGPTNLRSLVSQAKKNPAALEGLRAAGIDWMMRQFSNAAEAPGTGENLLSSARFAKFVRDNQTTLAELYSPEQMNTFHAVAADLERADRSVSATRIKGSPGTAKDILPFREKPESHTGEVVGLIEGLKEVGEHVHEGSFGKAALLAAAGLGGLKAVKYVKTLREAGIDKVQDAVKDALLNPERARYYLGKSTPKEAEGKLHALARSVRRSLIMQPVMQTATIN